MTRTPLPHSPEIEPRPSGKPGYQIWPTLLMILVGGSVLVLLLATQLGPTPSAPLLSNVATTDAAAVARAHPASRGRPGARATGQHATGVTPGGAAARSDAALMGSRAVPAGSPDAATGQQAAGESDPGPGGAEDDLRAQSGLAGIGGTGSATPEDAEPPVPPVSNDPAGEHGIEVASLRMTAGGTAVDFRYKVVDPEKAAKVGREGGPSYILDAEGRRISPRNVQGIGDYYSARHLDQPGHVYSTWFANQGGALRSGDVVSVVIGDLRVANVPVE